MQRLLRLVQRKSCRFWQLFVLQHILRGELRPRHAPLVLQPTSKPGRPQKGVVQLNYTLIEHQC